MHIANNTIVNNTCSVNGGGIHHTGNSQLEVRNTIFWNNTAEKATYKSIYSTNFSVTYSDVEGGWPGEGNINSNPLFADAENSDYHLQLDSPGIDSGDLDDDYGNGPLPNGGRINMGAYGNTADAALSSNTQFGSLTGTVVDDDTGEAISGAVVTLSSGDYTTTTGGDGTFTFD